eukprot:1484139-Prymnesium_polylepis.1
MDNQRIHAEVQRLAARAGHCTHDADHRGAITAYKQIRTLGLSVRQDAAFSQNIEAASLGGMGNAWVTLGEYDEALECFLPALDISRRIRRVLLK